FVRYLAIPFIEICIVLCFAGGFVQFCRCPGTVVGVDGVGIRTGGNAWHIHGWCWCRMAFQECPCISGFFEAQCSICSIEVLKTSRGHGQGGSEQGRGLRRFLRNVEGVL